MSSALRLSIIMVFVLATAALGLIAYSMNLPKAQVPVQIAESTPAPAPAPVGYFVAAHPLPRGTLARDEDFTTRSASSSDGVPAGAILDTPDARIGLRGSLVRNFLDTGSPVTSRDILRPRERGFLASVLAPDSRAISINVDAASGVSGLIWPGDYVDVVLTEESTTASEKQNPDHQHGTLTETVAHNVRIVAIDQEIVQGGSASNASAGKVARTVSLQLAPEQVKKVVVAVQLGKLSLAVRSAVDRQDTGDTDATIVIYARNSGTKYSVRRDDAGSTRVASTGDVLPAIASSTPVDSAVSSRR
ncbi:MULTISPECIES: Flp pilus assembly protein CpaB [Bradyrhizobium]|uniref:Flp pilus assembly protein CpaB n=1 Tax=Bradyrhizobium TaxID=374 RepID=UPI001BA50A17|nr:MULTISPECIES: Flp pilus assembly protein CpaB [Bradyrhizobium]MBR1028319.1 Flp pilus assembly protein CpaB [Bradyrhizobium liaoningense]MCP1760998.1 pilus assembly protein CpaB [Bradyrhizobium japonicum]MCP1792577.1 pilus assembly protein CpaB [Bradyrhizobium japonicum]MCP1805012.1 pilus assembly protein CpaB [Bradyrhizobium japonicum]MCP1814033.1 pilus assembly protein CpaB [Bradyrhizobium japonicum]